MELEKSYTVRFAAAIGMAIFASGWSDIQWIHTMGMGVAAFAGILWLDLRLK